MDWIGLDWNGLDWIKWINMGGDLYQYSVIPLATIFTLGGGAFRVVEACLNERSIRVERRVSTRGVYIRVERRVSTRSIRVERRVSTRGVGVLFRSSGEALGYQ